MKCLGNFCNKISRKELSKIAQSGHTVYHQPFVSSICHEEFVEDEEWDWIRNAAHFSLSKFAIFNDLFVGKTCHIWLTFFKFNKS